MNKFCGIVRCVTAEIYNIIVYIIWYFVTQQQKHNKKNLKRFPNTKYTPEAAIVNPSPRKV